mmetsp:Transcript_31914/g.90643  ORF Transcript_31914/g.90643 Transcript_31914/m.90643 type:complete len:454 (+) Transcript_31914:152-1513(+)
MSMLTLRSRLPGVAALSCPSSARPKHVGGGAALCGRGRAVCSQKRPAPRSPSFRRQEDDRCNSTHTRTIFAAAALQVDSAAEMVTRRAWRYTAQKAGKISGMELLADDMPCVCRGDVRVKVEAVGLNFADVFTCLGLYNAFPGVGIPGLEFAGVVEEVDGGSAPLREGQSSAVQEAGEAALPALKVGDRVMGVTRFGAFADQVVLPAHQVRPLPEGWDFTQGAAFLVQGLTAIYGLKQLGAIRKGHRVLVHSAAGGVGLFALGICEAVGAVPIATVGSDSKVDFLLLRFKSLSKETIIVRDASTFSQQLADALAASGASAFDIVLDAVAGRFFEPGYNLLERGGRYVVFGAADLTPQGDGVGWLKLAWQWISRPRVDPMKMIGENRAVMGFNLIWMFDRVEVLMELADELLSVGLPPPFVGERFAFTEAPEAIRKLQSGTTKGKVVLMVGGEQ